MDQIILGGMRFRVSIGVGEAERQKTTEVGLDLTLWLPLEEAGHSDDLTHTVDYAALYQLIQVVMAGEFRLLEALAFQLLGAIRREFPMVKEATASVTKLNPPVSGLPQVTVVMRR